MSDLLIGIHLISQFQLGTLCKSSNPCNFVLVVDRSMAGQMAASSRCYRLLVFIDLDFKRRPISTVLVAEVLILEVLDSGIFLSLAFRYCFKALPSPCVKWQCCHCVLMLPENYERAALGVYGSAPASRVDMRVNETFRGICVRDMVRCYDHFSDQKIVFYVWLVHMGLGT